MASFAPLGVPSPWRSDSRRLLKRLRPSRATETDAAVDMLEAPGDRRDVRVAEGRKLLVPQRGADSRQQAKAVAVGEGVAIARGGEVNVDASGALSLAREEARREAKSRGSMDEEDGVEEEGKGAEGMFSGSLKGLLFLNLGAAMFGSNQVVIKTTEKNLSPGALSALRFLIAAVAFSPSIVRGLQMPKLRSAAFELGCWLFGGYTAQALGLVSTSASRGAFTGTFTVLVVPMLVGLSGRKISPSTWAAAAVALLGVGLLTTSGPNPNVGDAWCICSAILFGVHKWRSEELTAQFEETSELVAVQIFFLACAASVYCLPELWHTLHSSTLPQLVEHAKGLPWPALAYMGLGTTALTLWMEMTSLKEVSAPLAALIYTAEPVWGSLFAYLCLHERWGAMGWLGATLIIGSSLFAQLSGDSAKLEDGTDEPKPEKMGS